MMNVLGLLFHLLFFLLPLLLSFSHQHQLMQHVAYSNSLVIPAAVYSTNCNPKNHYVVFPVLCTTVLSTLCYCHTSDTVIKCVTVSMQKLRQRLCYVSRKYDHTTAEVPSIMLWHALLNYIQQ